MRIFIEPTEPLLFRTGRPFNAGESNFADSIFPPTPETMQGAMRAMIAVHWSKGDSNRPRTLDELFQPQSDLVKLIGSRATYGRFRITGLTLARRNLDTRNIERLFPAPAHLIWVTFEGEQNKTIVRLRPEDKHDIQSNLPHSMQILLPELGDRQTEGKSEPLNCWLTSRGLKSALRQPQKLELDDKDIVVASKIYEKESRLGIGMQNATKVTREGYLYQVQMIRMQPGYGLVVDIQLSETSEGGSKGTPYSEKLIENSRVQEELKLPEEGWLTLGGEQRAAHFEVLKASSIAEENSLENMKAGRLLYLATPAYFKGGWQPEDKSILPDNPISAAINRYLPIGGWYLNPGNAGGESKYTRRCVPAGSIYFFERSVTVTQPLTEYGWQIGYGIAYAGVW